VSRTGREGACARETETESFVSAPSESVGRPWRIVTSYEHSRACACVAISRRRALLAYDDKTTFFRGDQRNARLKNRLSAFPV
jgi:hypothetical protein